MATYYHGNPAEIHGPDGLQTLVLMNPPPTYVQYSDNPPPSSSSHHQNNLLFLNSAAGAVSLSAYPPPPPQQQHPPSHTQQFVGIPLPTAATTTTTTHLLHHHQEPTDNSTLHGLIPRLHYNLYNNNNPMNLSPHSARDTPRAQQGLSLSLSNSQQPVVANFCSPQGYSGEDMRGGSGSSGSGVTNGVSGMQGVLLSSKYLKAAQEILDEVVNVNNNNDEVIISKIGIDQLSKKNNSNDVHNNKLNRESSTAGNGGETGGKSDPELTTAERQEIQMKKAKLISMLDEVEQRYRQYHHQMQIVISSFQQAAGIGSAKTYTALALKTISKQFRCLKDAITGQIRAANKSLGEDDCLGGKIEGSRLKFVDHHLRQQRALQQLGMIQHNAWRPQRGLPERSVSVLRAWLFEHFLHPYPKDSDKHMLAKQTGLTRSQVSNWFINARVRLWKPMVEEMYMEELKEQEHNGGSEDKASKSDQKEDSTSMSTDPQEKSPVPENQPKSFKDGSTNQNVPSSLYTASTSTMAGNFLNQTGFSLIGSSELDGITQASPKKLRSNDMMQSPTSVPSVNMDVKPTDTNNEQIAMKFGDERQSRDGYSFIGNHSNFIGGFGQYPIGEIGRFDAEQFTPRFSGNGVSLTLGLPHCENLSLSGTHQTFLPNQSIHLGRRLDIDEPNEFGAITTSTAHTSASAYDSINIQNRKRFAAQILHDFVA